MVDFYTVCFWALFLIGVITLFAGNLTAFFGIVIAMIVSNIAYILAELLPARWFKW